MNVDLHLGDCVTYMRTLESESVSAVVTDPPYHLTSIVKRFSKEKPSKSNMANGGAPPPFARHSKGFLGKAWDGGDIAFRPEVWIECLRVLKPGGYLLAFGGTRTYHRLACAIEDAGFVVYDMIEWVYGEGFPKSHNVSHAIGKKNGSKMKLVGKPTKGGSGKKNTYGNITRPPKTKPEDDLALQWDGFGTALKPAHEPVVLARKPVDGTIAENVIKHGTGAMNIEASRVGNRKILVNTYTDRNYNWGVGTKGDMAEYEGGEHIGNWPANIIHDGSREVIKLFPDGTDSFFKSCPFQESDFDWLYYCSKPNQNERGGNSHPTVKPVSLMQYLVNMVTVSGATVLDPFLGSGTTGVACAKLGRNFIGCDIESEYIEIARRRIEEAQRQMVLL